MKIISVLVNTILQNQKIFAQNPHIVIAFECVNPVQSYANVQIHSNMFQTLN